MLRAPLAEVYAAYLPFLLMDFVWLKLRAHQAGAFRYLSQRQ